MGTIDRRSALLRRSMSLLAATGLPIAVADRGTHGPFLDFLHETAGVRVTVPPYPGLVAQVRASMELAAGFDRPFIVYLEPDKELFFRDGLGDFLQQALQIAQPGVVLAGRSAEAFATYPATQRYTEGVINHLCGEALGRAGDYSYGPFMMDRVLLSDIACLDGALGWGWRPSVFVSALRRGFAVDHVVGNHSCPPEQRMEDDGERTHRLRQLSQNILGLVN